MTLNAVNGCAATTALRSLMLFFLRARALLRTLSFLLIPCLAWATPESPRQYLGHLGGAKFSFPQSVVQNLEYDGDPGWGEARPKERPERTFESGFRSMGLKFSYPDFVPLKPSAPSTQPVVKVTIIANSYFGDGNFLKRSFANINSDPDLVYTEAKARFHGLRHFVLRINPDYLSKSPTGVSRMRDVDIFLSEKNGNIRTYIECGNTRGDNSICSQSILLHDYKSKIIIDYKREILYDWLKIENIVVSRIELFEVK